MVVRSTSSGVVMPSMILLMPAMRRVLIPCDTISDLISAAEARALGNKRKTLKAVDL